MEKDPTLWMIFLALVSGVLTFGAVVAFVRPDPTPVSGFDVLGWMPMFFAALAVFAAAFFRGRLPADATIDVRRTSAIMTWCFAEGAALFGLVIILISGAIYPAGLAVLVGLAVMVKNHPGTFL